jgi:hypothetical protein
MIPLLVIWSDIVPQPETQHSWQKEMLLKKSLANGHQLGEWYFPQQ